MDQLQKPFLRLDTVILRVKDIKKASHWYQQKLGFRAAYANDNEKLVVFELQGTTSLTIWQLKEKEKHAPAAPSGSYPIFLSDDIESTHAALKSQRVRLDKIEQNNGLRWFSFYDPDGNRMEVCQIS